MSKALIAGINQVATDKGLDREVIFQAIEAALVSAYRRNYGSVANVTAEVDRTSGDMHVFAEREVVEDVMNPRTEITEQDVRKLQPTAKLGDVVRVPSTPDDFGRIAAQTAKQVILQRIREAERDTVYENFAHQVNEIVSTQVRSIDAQSGAVTVLLGEKYEVLLMREDLIASEKLRRGDFVKVYVVDVHKSNRGPVIKLSRTHRNLLADGAWPGPHHDRCTRAGGAHTGKGLGSEPLAGSAAHPGSGGNRQRVYQRHAGACAHAADAPEPRGTHRLSGIQDPHAGEFCNLDRRHAHQHRHLDESSGAVDSHGPRHETDGAV